MDAHADAAGKQSTGTLTVFPVPAFQDNYLWVVDNGKDAVVVDPGEAAPVLAYLETRGLTLRAILITHKHADHIGGVDALLQHFDVPVHGPAREAIACVDHPHNGGETVHIASPAMVLEVIDVPGHTSGHIAYFLGAGAAGAPRLFCGDTLFSCGCGRLFEGTPAQMLASLDALAALPAATLVHCAHEYTLSNLRFALAVDPDNAALAAWHQEATALRAAGRPTLPTTLAQERATNPFLRSDAPAVIAAAQAHAGRTALSREAVFATVRGWKDTFR
ncbi:hydroxyacylglutathione hydrolase [Pandoraea bronchicola]|uniref:Hydroxyacylglutathione hydrolase n=1 Tax=Pandoraea bronchicola TaxID=2508287 RepID=A0A5E5C0Y3_9BURK|nr:hydroxyacylglutathione hydrolase [Pandoraea bronchicola]VVE90270.1 hydroxyacylglutathione hydrolase [Pandoraea bronchicola]